MSAEFLPGNHIELLETGSEFFPALLAAIDRAVCEIHLETYIFADDATGRQIAEALAAAARRGVKVRVLIDGFGARDFPVAFAHAFAEAGVELAIYRQEALRLPLRRNRLRRLHRKLAAIDGQFAFVGGINIIDDADTPDLGPRFDYAVRVTGPLVTRICQVMTRLWRLVGWVRLQRRPPPLPLPACLGDTTAGAMTAALVIRDNIGHRRDIEDAYLAAIAGARTELLLASAYFLPGRRFRHALHDAAARGVAVTILLQGQVEYALLHYATQALYRNLLDNGVRIREYHAGFLHAKVAVIDQQWATVGSSNIDPFSLLLAREANVIVRDGPFAARLRTSLLGAIERDSREITGDDLRRSPLWSRSLRWAAYGLVRLLLGLTRYGGSDYRE